jgi:hypothetical protein
MKLRFAMIWPARTTRLPVARAGRCRMAWAAPLPMSILIAAVFFAPAIVGKAGWVRADESTPGEARVNEARVSEARVSEARVSEARVSEARVSEEFFEKEIRPLLLDHCAECHGVDSQEAGLRVDSREALLQGGDSGAALVPGDVDASLILQAVRYLGEPKMPPKGKLSASDIQKLETWVAKNAPWPAPSRPVGDSPGAAKPAGFAVSEQQRNWWAFQPIANPVPPAVRREAWVRNEIDRFILAGLESQGLEPAPEADRRQWLRRVTFDLIGLPPTPDEIEAFLADRSQEAQERVVERLLASPEYGRRWARHWLDVVRYADFYDPDPKTRTPSCEITEAWRYRDWVVDSLNRDLPYNEFIVHQIAGDQLPSPTGAEVYPDGLVATTFLSNGAWDRGDADKEKMVSDMVDDNVDTIGKVFLGLTLGCARCHDHKFDPVSQADYYGLAGMFYSSHLLKDLGAKGGEYTMSRVPLVPRAEAERYEEHARRLAESKSLLEMLDKRDPKPGEQDPERLELLKRIEQQQAEMPPDPPRAIATTDGGTPGGMFPGIQDVPIHIRGSYTRLGPVVPRRMPVFFAGESQPLITQGSGRRELALWIASDAHPLTARVLVNRLWLGHFGEGLVRTPNNFGLLSEPPSHPELLDWLATRFMREGWSIKAMHRLMVLSATYAQSSVVPRERLERDPENRWLSRFAARRLEAEAMRDAMLSVAGRLDLAGGGPAGDDLNIRHRSLYVQTARWDRSSYATLFDAANPDASTDKRVVSTVAPQALFLLNHAFVLEQARHLADRLQRDVPTADGDTAAQDASHSGTSEQLARRRIDRAFQLLFGRPATDEERQVGQRVIAASDTASPPGVQGLVDFAHLLLCSNEFLYVD